MYVTTANRNAEVLNISSVSVTFSVRTVPVRATRQNHDRRIIIQSALAHGIKITTFTCQTTFNYFLSRHTYTYMYTDPNKKSNNCRSDDKTIIMIMNNCGLYTD